MARSLARIRYPGYAWPEVLNDFVGGLNLRDAAGEIADNESPDLFNVTFDERGGVGSRLGYAKYNPVVYESGDLVVSGLAWDETGHKVVQCGPNLYLDTATGASGFLVVASSDPCGFAAFNGALWIIHPVSGLYYSDGTVAGTHLVSTGPTGTCLAVWQNRLWAVDGTSTRLKWSAIGDGTQWTPSATTLNGAVTLPVATITVASTSGFDPSGALTVGVGSSAKVVSYTGTTATTFTGCSGGSHVFATGTAVTQGQNFVDIREKDDRPLVCLKGASGQDILGAAGLIVAKHRSTYRVNDSDTGAYTTIDPEVGAASARAMVAVAGRVYALSEQGIWWTDGLSPMQNEGDKLRPLWSDAQLAFDRLDLWCAGEKNGRLYFSVPLVGADHNGLALEHFPAGRPEGAATVIGSNAMGCYFTSHADEQVLFGGSPTVNGQAYMIGTGGTDDGAAVHAYFETAWLALTPPYRGRLRSLVVEGRGEDVDVYVKRDFTTGQGDASPVSMSLASARWNDGSKWNDGTTWGPSTFVAFSDPLGSLGVANVFAFRFDATTSSTSTAPALLNGALAATVGAWAVFGLHVKAIPLRAI